MPHHADPGEPVSGTRPHGYTDGGNPVKVGGKASAATPAPVDDGDRVDGFYDLNGRLVFNFGTRLQGLLDSVQLQMHNGTAPEDLYDNVELVLLPSLARAATLQSVAQTNRNARGLQLAVNVSANAAGGAITPSLQIQEPISGNWFTFWTATVGVPLTTVALFVYVFYPGASSSSFTELWPFGLAGRTWRLNVTHGNANLITYSVSGVYLL